MIKIAGSVHRSFIFPADIRTAFEYYADLQRTLNLLPHVSILERYSEGQYRMLYSATELGIYRVRMICNMQTELDRQGWVMRILPLEGLPEIEAKAGIYSLSSQGFYSSESIFKPGDGKTGIDYNLRLRAQLPVPLGLRFMPPRLINEIARNITQWRINEIAEGFIERSLLAFEKLQQRR